MMKSSGTLLALLAVSLGVVAGAQVKQSAKASLPTPDAMRNALPTLGEVPGFRTLGPGDVMELPDRRGARVMFQRPGGGMLDVEISTWKTENRPLLPLNDNPGRVYLVDPKATPQRLSDFTLLVRRPPKSHDRSTYNLAGDAGRTFIFLRLNVKAGTPLFDKSFHSKVVSDADRQFMEKLLVTVANRARKNGLIRKGEPAQRGKVGP